MFDLLHAIHDLLEGQLVRRSERRKARRHTLERLKTLNSAQKQLLRSYLNEAARSRKRTFRHQPDEGGADAADAELPFLMDGGGVERVKYAPRHAPTYCFESWLFDYLRQHPELFEPDDDASEPAAYPSASAL